MKNITFVIIALFLLSFNPMNFKTTQLKNSRVKKAYEQKEKVVMDLLGRKSISTPHIFIRAFKSERLVEVWAKEKSGSSYSLITQYDFCSTSGDLGPKRRQGDLQIPEGMYFIDRFNPWSNFHLSLGINYPNASDRILGRKSDLGGDIFIHGDCVTIGCIPITDDKIKELYIFAVEAKNNGQQKIPVHIFPSKLSEQGFAKLKREHAPGDELLGFWANLKMVYQAFERNRTLPSHTVLNSGRYQLN